MSIYLRMVTALLIVLAGCDSGSMKTEEETKPEMFETQLDALEKAKGVENMMLDATQERNKSLD